MKISELVEQLTKIQQEHGDVDVNGSGCDNCCYTEVDGVSAAVITVGGSEVTVAALEGPR